MAINKSKYVSISRSETDQICKHNKFANFEFLEFSEYDKIIESCNNFVGRKNLDQIYIAGGVFTKYVEESYLSKISPKAVAIYKSLRDTDVFFLNHYCTYQSIHFIDNKQFNTVLSEHKTVEDLLDNFLFYGCRIAYKYKSNNFIIDNQLIIPFNERHHSISDILLVLRPEFDLYLTDSEAKWLKSDAYNSAPIVWDEINKLVNRLTKLNLLMKYVAKGFWGTQTIQPEIENIIYTILLHVQPVFYLYSKGEALQTFYFDLFKKIKKNEIGFLDVVCLCTKCGGLKILTTK